MTTQQPEALRREYRATMPPEVLHLWAADALACIASLEAQLTQRFDAADMATAAAQGFRDGVASLAASAGGGPVAWYEYNADLDAWFLAYSHNPKAKTRPLVFGDTTPQPTQTQAVAVPLTDEQIAEMMRDTWGCASIAPRHALEFARAVERAHGITQKGDSNAENC